MPAGLLVEGGRLSAKHERSGEQEGPAAVTEGMEMGWDVTKDWTLNLSPGTSELHDG